MDLLIFASSGLSVLVILFCLLLFLSNSQKVKLLEEHSTMLDKISELRNTIQAMKESQKTQLSIEAQQILHDMTAHGNSIIRITPISPTDVFWKSPR